MRTNKQVQNILTNFFGASGLSPWTKPSTAIPPFVTHSQSRLEHWTLTNGFSFLFWLFGKWKVTPFSLCSCSASYSSDSSAMTPGPSLDPDYLVFGTSGMVICSRCAFHWCQHPDSRIAASSKPTQQSWDDKIGRLSSILQTSHWGSRFCVIFGTSGIVDTVINGDYPLVPINMLDSCSGINVKHRRLNGLTTMTTAVIFTLIHGEERLEIQKHKPYVARKQFHQNNSSLSPIPGVDRAWRVGLGITTCLMSPWHFRCLFPSNWCAHTESKLLQPTF